MKPKLLALSIIVSLATGLTHAAESKRTLVWGHEAMKLTLSVGDERVIVFPQPLVDLQMPQYLTSSDMSRPELLPDGRLFWLANDEWDEVRIRAIGADGEVYLLDVSASTAANENHPVEIVKSIPVEQERLDEASASRVPAGGYDYIDLARYAAQHAYGPSRHIVPLSGVSRAPMEQHVVDIYRGVGLEISTVAQWKSDHTEQYVTMLKVVNTTSRDITVDPRKLRGNWLFAAPHNDMVLPSGYTGDDTRLYVVSDRPFYRSIPKLFQAHVRGSEEHPSE